MEIIKILWATDLSENASAALPFVSSMAEKYQSEVHVLYVLEEIGHFGAWYGEFDRTHLDQMMDMEKEKAEKRLDEICQHHLNECPLYIRHTAVGDPAGEILKKINTEKPDMIVMASRGRKGRFSFGSVAEKVTKHSAVPVLIIPVSQST